MYYSRIFYVRETRTPSQLNGRKGLECKWEAVFFIDEVSFGKDEMTVL